MTDSTTENKNGAADANRASSADAHRAETNRANAKHSTGPRTEPGKRRSSLNALRHGLTGHVIVLPSEDHAAYETHTRRLFLDLQPKGALEEQLVQSLTDTSWRINRIAALETSLLALGIHEQSANIETAHPEAHAALAMAAAVREHTRALSNLSMHEHRLSRQFERTLKQLREIQADRCVKEKEQMENAARLLSLHQSEGLPYDPAEDGFVFSNDEIETSLRRTHRIKEANSAYYQAT
jgi:hypothetical protein